jgi:presenilin-like A22 family membrane protease
MRAVLAAGFVGLLFVLVQLGSLALVEPFTAAGYQAVEDPQDPTNSLIYIVAILVVTALMIAVIRLDVERIIRAVVVFAGVYISWFVFSVVVPAWLTLGGWNVLAIAAAVGLGVALYAHPEWYVIDAAGVVMGAGAAGLFGISFGLLPALLLLAALAVYDAVSVYGTEHMLELASGVMDLKVPIVLVIPLSLSYSFLDAEMPDPTDDEEPATDGSDAPDPTDDEEPATDGSDAPEPSDDGDAADDEPEPDGIDADPLERDALFIGLGDAVIPTVLVASAAFFAPASVPQLDLGGLPVAVTALGAMVGTLAGLAVLMRMVLKGRAHAGLPLLNGGAIAGYLVAALASGLPLADALGLATYF